MSGQEFASSPVLITSLSWYNLTIQPQYSPKIDSLVSLTKLRFIFFLEICVILFVLSLAGTLNILGTTDTIRTDNESYRSYYLADSRNVTDIPYFSQQMNGLCHWAAQAMALESAGVSLDLAGECAVTGIGFSAGYVRYEDIWIFVPGPSYRQQVTFANMAELYGLDVEFYVDTDCSEFSSLFALSLQSNNVNWTEINGWDDAFQILKASIDDGYPVEVYVDLYNLPHPDYDFVRDLGLSDSNPSHSILITGYNETAGVAYVMDPAIGVLENSVAVPDDDSWFYEINFTSLNQGWSKSYASAVIKPISAINHDFTSILGNYILDRLRGDRTSYAPASEEVFFWNFGSNAFRAMASELTESGLTSYLDEFDEYDLQIKARILENMGIELEAYLTLQYEAYRMAVSALPDVLPELNLDEFVSEGEKAFEHFNPLTDNSSINNLFYTGGATIASKTFNNIAYQYEHVLDGDLSSAVSEFEEDLAEIRHHLTSIANAWDAAADALERELLEPGLPFIPSMTGIGAIIVLTLAILGKRRRDSRV